MVEEVEIKKKDFKYRGIELEDLKKLDVREVAKYLKSGKRRIVLRQFQKIEDFMNRAKEKVEKNKPIKTHLRDIVIVPGMIGLRIHVHNGKGFTAVNIEEDMIGHSLGEFALTRARIKHSKAGVGATKGSMHKSKK
ncbi:MAG: ribosomal protein S19 family protein [Nanoarchaeota archaeon]|nr:ribosomal protein S19 family protein [Nanoarchaeota archaeon]MBU1501165.1 ribosomal protein S19 family protein [Nanoarchaeota archaeon]MBU2458845.1 ribosomal protein S19 family protein [Nanoarchaeota archaeon]